MFIIGLKFVLKCIWNRTTDVILHLNLDFGLKFLKVFAIFENIFEKINKNVDVILDMKRPSQSPLLPLYSYPCLHHASRL